MDLDGSRFSAYFLPLLVDRPQRKERWILSSAGLRSWSEPSKFWHVDKRTIQHLRLRLVMSLNSSGFQNLSTVPCHPSMNEIAIVATRMISKCKMKWMFLLFLFAFVLALDASIWGAHRRARSWQDRHRRGFGTEDRGRWCSWTVARPINHSMVSGDRTVHFSHVQSFFTTSQDTWCDDMWCMSQIQLLCMASLGSCFHLLKESASCNWTWQCCWLAPVIVVNLRSVWRMSGAQRHSMRATLYVIRNFAIECVFRCVLRYWYVLYT